MILLLTSKVPHRCETQPTMKPYPLGINNPIIVKGVMGTHKWALHWRDDLTKIATFNSQHQAMSVRQSIIEAL